MTKPYCLKYLLVAFLCFFFIANSFAEKASEKRLYDKFWSIVDQTPSASIPIIDSLINIYGNEISVEKAEAYFGKGYAHYEASQYKESIKAYLQASVLFNALHDTCYLKRTYFNLGSSLNMLGDYVDATNYYLKSIEIENCSNLAFAKGADHYNLALLFSDLNLTDDAIKQYKLAIATDSIGQNISFIQLSKLGVAYQNFYDGNQNSAIKTYKNVFRQSLNDTLEFFSIYFYGYSDLAEMYATIQQFDSAYKYYNLAHNLVIQDSIADYLINDYLVLAEIYKQEEKYDAALTMALKGLELAKQIGFKQNKVIAFSMLSEIEELIGNFSKATFYLKAERALLDSIYQNQTKSTYLTKTLDDKAKEILTLSKSEEEAKLKFENLKITLYAFLCFLIILIILVLLVNKQRKVVKELNKNQNELIEEKDRIMTVLSHDLRSPISAVKGIIELFKLKLLNASEKESMILELENSINSLNSNLNTLLDWALTSKSYSQPQFSNVKIQPIIEKTFNFLKQQATQKNIDLKYISNTDSITCFIDKDHLELILRNFISNAIKFSKKNSIIKVYSEEKGEKINITIEDSGIGISKDDLEKIKNFKKVKHKGTLGEMGLGLGLQLVNFYTNLNNGIIKVESELNKGSSFTVSFPK